MGVDPVIAFALTPNEARGSKQLVHVGRPDAPTPTFQLLEVFAQRHASG